MDTEPRTRKNDSIDSTQDAKTHHPDEKKIQKKTEKQVIVHKVEEGIDDKTEIVALMVKAVMVRAQNLKMMWAVE